MPLTTTVTDLNGKERIAVLEADVHALHEILDTLEAAFLEAASKLEETNARFAAVNKQLLGEIADRKTVEEALEKREKWFSTTLSSIGDAVIATDPEGRINFMNAVAQKLTGWSATEAYGKRLPEVFKIVNETTREVLEDPVAKVIRLGGIVGLANHTLLIAKDGREIPIDDSGAPITNDEGKMLGVVLVFRDIIERHNAENLLREGEERYRALFADSSDAIMVVDPAKGFTDGNQAAVTLFGCASEAEFLAQSPATLSPEYQADGALSANKAIEMLAMALETGSNFFEWTHKRLNGEEFHATVLLSRLNLVNRQLLQATVRDTTDKKLAEEQRKVMEIHLRSAQKMESIGQLAAGIAHEINTPIQYVGDHARFLKESFGDLLSLVNSYREALQGLGDAVPEVIHERLRDAETQTDLDYLLTRIPRAIEQSLEGVGRVSTIVKAMREFSHPGVEEKIPTNLNGCVENTVTVSRNEWKYAADLETLLDPDLPAVSCLPSEINQVLLNLIVNAAHAIAETDKGAEGAKGRIVVGTRVMDARTVELRVTDTGAGIPEKIRNRIFDPFFTTKEVGKGTGQGLALSYNIVVKRHGGTITFESEVGKGTTFYVRLPVIPPCPASL